MTDKEDTGSEKAAETPPVEKQAAAEAPLPEPSTEPNPNADAFLAKYSPHAKKGLPKGVIIALVAVPVVVVAGIMIDIGNKNAAANAHWKTVEKQADAALQKGNHDEASKLYEQAAKEAKETAGGDMQKMQKVCDLLGLASNEATDQTRTRYCVLAEETARLSPSMVDRAEWMISAGNTHMSVGRYEEGKRDYKQVVDWLKGSIDPELQAKHKEAEGFYKIAEQNLKASKGK